MSIDWQTTLARLDAAPNVGTPNGQSVLSALLSAGRAYDSAGKPDVMHESEQHRAWAARRPSERIGQPEPSFYVGAYYTRLASLRAGSTSALLHPTFSPEDLKALPSDALSAYRFWQPKDPQIARQIASYYIAKAEAAERESAAARSPTLGAIQGALTAALSAAQAFLAA